MRHFRSSQTRGFTLVEVIMGAALFSLVAISVYQSYVTLTTLVAASRVKITGVDLVNERLELIRNLPYSQVGLVGGIPAGLLNRVESFTRDGNTFIATTTIRNVDDPFDKLVTGSPQDLSPADYKSVTIDLQCTNCKNFVPISVSTRVAPKNLESASTNGSLFIRVFDANGNPIQAATVEVTNTKLTPNISITEVTDDAGMLQIVDAPPSTNGYNIVVSKSGYTSDRTYATSTGNPNPTNPDATVVLQQVTQVSFVIDRVSSMGISAVTSTCEPVPGLGFTLTGTKTIGSSPVVYKYNQSHTLDGGGQKNISNIEWDTYSLNLTGGSYYLAGVNPLLPVGVLPNAHQSVQLIVAENSPSMLLVTVKDSATGLPLSGATVTLSKTGYSETQTTGRGFMGQTDWSGGAGQSQIGNPDEYLDSDGNVAISNPAGELKLSGIFGEYSASGNLTSSTFDTGTTSNFSTINWSPTSQPAQTGNPNVRFQIASNNDNNTWIFTGPDGTDGSYYTTSDTNIHATTSNNQYFRYKVFLDTEDTDYTPNIAEVALTFTSACIPPGQVLFSGLSNGTYDLTVENPGYTDFTGSVSVSGSWQERQVNLGP